MSHHRELIPPVLDTCVTVEVTHETRDVLQHQRLSALTPRPVLVAIPPGVSSVLEEREINKVRVELGKVGTQLERG